MKTPIYMDYMATTPVDPAVVQAMQTCLERKEAFGNPSSRSHVYGYVADELVHNAAESVASLINAQARELTWTSGATESNNLAIKGAAYLYRRKGCHIVTMSTEHKSVLNTCRYLETQGFEVTYLDPKSDGLLDLSQLKQAIRMDTILVSVMHVNNETGVIQDIEKIADIAHASGAILHSDATQSVGKIAVDVRQIKVDLMSFSGHKMYGPKGIGVLFVSRSPRIRLETQMHGGGQQRGLRSGTLPTHQIVGMGESCLLAKMHFESDCQRLAKLSQHLWQGISMLPEVTLNGHLEQKVCHCFNICVKDISAEDLLESLNRVAFSSGSACNAGSVLPSHVLLSMGLSHDAARRSLRISIGRFTTEKDVDFAIAHFTQMVKHLL